MHLDHLHPTVLLLAAAAYLPSTAVAARPPSKNAILLSQVQSLTLRGGGAQTTHRRAPAVPQLKCVSPQSICRLHEIDVMRCTNQGAGYDAEDIQWACTASLPPELKLGATDVQCEGYGSRDDPYVLKGSCGVEYRLVLTEAGEQKYPKAGGSRGWGSGSGSEGGGGESDWSAWLFGIIFVAVVVWIVYSACGADQQLGQPRRPRRPRNDFWGGGGGFWGGGGGGGGGGDPFDPPPPYPGTSKPTTSSAGWQPGFWSGLAGGAAAGYMAGQRGNHNRDSNRDSGGNARSSSWGSGLSGSGSSSSSASTSTARHESTGFGGTSRR